MRVRTLVPLFLVSCLAATVLLPAGPAGGASFPGGNGRIAFPVGSELKTVDPDGSGLTTLVASFNGRDVAWSPDGRQLAYRSGAPNYGIASIKRDGTGLVQVSTGNGDSQPAWSPDSTKVAFVDPLSDLIVTNADGTGRTNLTSSFDKSVSDPQWSPQGDVIAFAGSGTALYLIDPEGGTPEALSTDFDTRGISWSPDGQHIAFGHGPNEIWVMDRDGSNSHLVADGFAQLGEFSWSPDGTKIAFINVITGTGTRLWMMNADGSNQQDLGIDTSYTLDWEPRPTADLEVTQTDTDPVNIGENVTYTLTVTNKGPHPAFGVKLIDSLPSGASFVSATPSQGSCSGTTTVTCSIGWVPSAGTVTVTMVATANAAGTLSNTATVSHSNMDADPVASNDAATETTRVFDPNDLLVLTKLGSAERVSPGGSLTYMLTVENIGAGGSADDVVVTDALPATLSFVSASTTAGSCTGTTTVECDLGSLALGDAATITIEVTTGSEGNVSNTATVSTSSVDPKPSNNSATASTTVGKIATAITLKVSKTTTRWTAKGKVTPSLPGKKVVVTWYKKSGGAFKKLSSASTTLNSSSAYSSSRKRVAAASCRVKARFGGDADHKASSRSKTFAC